MKLYRFRYSPFARKVQTVLDLLAIEYDAIEVGYSQRDELAELTGGYILVPVLMDGGRVLTESRDICEYLLARPDAAWLSPAALEGAVWGYADFSDGPLEDLMFRIASPDVRAQWRSPGERALYTLVKERKFGAGCVDRWLRERDQLIAGARKLLAPTERTLKRQRFLFGERPTLADAALHGHSLMLEEASAELLPQVSEGLAEHAARMKAFLAVDDGPGTARRSGSR
ncbi:MAG TPA: glutathione S-transferase [Polyangiales bacterium]